MASASSSIKGDSESRGRYVDEKPVPYQSGFIGEDRMEEKFTHP